MRVALGGAGPVQGAPLAGVLVDAGGGERTAAGAGGDLAALNRVTGDSLVDRLLSPASHNGANT